LMPQIIRVIMGSDVALTTREICCALNGKPKDYCMNVDGKGSRCVWWYRRPKHESQRIRLAKPDCRIRPIELYPYLKRLVSMGVIKRWEGYLPDKYSTWGYDRHVLYFAREDQLYKRLSMEVGRPLQSYSS